MAVMWLVSETNCLEDVRHQHVTSRRRWCRSYYLILWMEKNISFTSEKSLEMCHWVTNGKQRKSDRRALRMQFESTKQDVLFRARIYSSALFSRLLFCFCSAHMWSLKLCVITKPEDTKYLRLSGPFKENYGHIAFNCYQVGVMFFVEKWYRNISVN